MSASRTSAARVLGRARERGPAFPSGHPYNPRSELHGWLLSRAAGLGRIAVNLAWIPPGKESAIFHVHHREEEWVYLLEGSGIAEVDDTEHAVGPGDFLGFPPGTAHHLRNTGAKDLLVIEGGEVLPDADVADFPKLRRRLVRVGTRVSVYPLEAEIPFLPGDGELPAVLFGGGAKTAAPRVLVRAGERGPSREFRHPEGPDSEVHLTALSRPAGLGRIAVVHTRVPAGRASFVHHVHRHDEEWVYVLSGRGVAELGEREEEIGPGDFLGYPANDEPHNLRASPVEDLVYLQGGDAWSRTTIEIVDMPRLGLRRTFVGTREVATFPLDAARERQDPKRG
jgi:quercetin 2,3-dioxygenase